MTVTNLKTWTTSQQEEDAMFLGHFKFWQTMVDYTEEKNLRNKTVLDFGCNQGGFLRLLYNMRPFASAVGVDIAAESIAKAQRLNPGLPILYTSPDELSSRVGSFDIAFSHEVLYLLSDLDAHARQIAEALKSGGTYYAATGCFTENPLWSQWREVISGYSNIPVPDYSLDDYAAAFARHGFAIEMRPFRPDGFIRFDSDDKHYYKRMIDKVIYYNQHKMLFRFAKMD